MVLVLQHRPVLIELDIGTIFCGNEVVNDHFNVTFEKGFRICCDQNWNLFFWK